MNITRHAQACIQQRAIPPFVIDLLQDYGEVSYHRGREIFQFTQKSCRTIKRDLGKDQLPAIEKYFNAYIVTRENYLITVAYQDRHMKRNCRH